MRHPFFVSLSLIFLLLSCGSDGSGVSDGNISLSGRAPEEAEDRILIAFSQSGTDTPWKIEETRSIVEMAEDMGADLIMTDAEWRPAKQQTDIGELLERGPDYLIISPRDFNNFGSGLKTAGDAGVPVILVDRSAPGIPRKDYLTLIQGDFLNHGRTAAEIILEHFKGRELRIVEITGVSGASSSIERVIGMQLRLMEEPEVVIVDRLSGSGSRYTAQKTMETLIQTRGGEFNAVFAHDDQMALGVIQALKAAGEGFIPGEDVVVVSINGEKDALKAITAGELLATLDQSPHLGDVIRDVIRKHRNQEYIADTILIPGTIIDSGNVGKFQGY